MRANNVMYHWMLYINHLTEFSIAYIQIHISENSPENGVTMEVLHSRERVYHELIPFNSIP